MQRIDKHVLVLFAIISAAVVSVTTVPDALSNSEQVIRFANYSVLAPEHDEQGIPVLAVGDSATITVHVEKISDEMKIQDVRIMTSLSNSENGKFLLIDKNTIRIGVELVAEDISKYETKEVKTDPFANGKMTDPILVTITAINSPAKDFDDMINVELYANKEKMDEISFDVKM